MCTVHSLQTGAVAPSHIQSKGLWVEWKQEQPYLTFEVKGQLVEGKQKWPHLAFEAKGAMGGRESCNLVRRGSQWQHRVWRRLRGATWWVGNVVVNRQELKINIE